MGWGVTDTSVASGVTNAQAEKLAIIVHGTQTIDLDIETGTYDADVTTSSNRDVRARSWSNTNNGEGRYVIPPLPGRTGGNVVFRLWTTLGVSGSAGLEVAWRLAIESHSIGETLTASALGNSQTVYQDVSAQTAHVLTAFDITVSSSIFDQTKRPMLILERLASTDARDDYGAGSFFLHAIDILYTGWGVTAAPSAPA